MFSKEHNTYYTHIQLNPYALNDFQYKDSLQIIMHYL